MVVLEARYIDAGLLAEPFNDVVLECQHFGKFFVDFPEYLDDWRLRCFFDLDLSAPHLLQVVGV
jgi:hypothetical protein